MDQDPEDRALHEMSPTTRFTDRAADYVRYRPTYPAAAIDAMLRGLGDATRLIAADVGAGTGISSRLLADRGVRVIAIEPNQAMRRAAAPHPRIEWREGSAEATGLDGSSLDLVLCAQAFHWFREPQALAEFARVLKSQGRLALIWNNRDRRDELTQGFIEAIHAVNGEHPAERREFDPAALDRESRFTPVRLESFAHFQELDREGLIGRATSASYVRREGEAFEQLARLLTDLFDRHRDAGGRVRLRYVTNLYLAERR